MATHFSIGPWTAIDPRATKITLSQEYVSNERWVNRRWKPTVIPRAVKTYMPTRRPRSTQEKPQPQRKKGAAAKPKKGTTITIRVTNRTASAARSVAAWRGGNSATGSATGKAEISVMAELLDRVSGPAARRQQ